MAQHTRGVKLVPICNRTPRYYRVLKVFGRNASFRVALGFAQAPSQFARIPEQRFQPPAEGLLGLMVFREFIRTIYHEVEIYESGAFERGQC